MTMSTRHLAKRFDGVLGSSGDSGNFECRVGFDHARKHRAGDRRIIDDHQPDSAACGPRVPVAVPRTGERPLHGR